MSNNKCPYCYNDLSTTPYTHDPILMPNGAKYYFVDSTTLAEVTNIEDRIYKGIIQLDYNVIKELQDNRIALELIYLTEENRTTFSPLNDTGYFQVTVKYIQELRESTEKLLIEMGISKTDYFNNDSEGNHINHPNGDQTDWSDLNIEKDKYQIKYIHIEELRKNLTLLINMWIGGNYGTDFVSYTLGLNSNTSISDKTKIYSDRTIFYTGENLSYYLSEESGTGNWLANVSSRRNLDLNRTSEILPPNFNNLLLVHEGEINTFVLQPDAPYTSPFWVYKCIKSTWTYETVYLYVYTPHSPVYVEVIHIPSMTIDKNNIFVVAIAQSPSGHDYMRPLLLKFDLNMNFIAEYLYPAPPNFNDLDFAVITSDSNYLYVLDALTGTVKVFDKNFNLQLQKTFDVIPQTFGSIFYVNLDITCDSNYLYVLSKNRIYKITKTTLNLVETGEELTPIVPSTGLGLSKICHLEEYSQNMS